MSTPDCNKNCTFLKKQKEEWIKIGKRRLFKKFVFTFNELVGEIMDSEKISDEWVPKAKRKVKKK